MKRILSLAVVATSLTVQVSTSQAGVKEFFKKINPITILKPGVKPECTTDLSKGAIVVMSGGGFDGGNPAEVRERMEDYIASVNSDSHIQICSNGKGLQTKLLPGQDNLRNHQSEWPQLCKAISAIHPSPLVIAGHSNGGAAAVSLARCLQESKVKVDLLITADSVGTANDMGSVTEVPSNVKLNINTFLVPNAVTWLGPFPFGKANKREKGAPLKALYNVGMHYYLPAMVAHRNAFYDFAGGDKSEEGSYTKPFSLLSLTLAQLSGASADQMGKIIMSEMSDMGKAAGIRIDVTSENLKATLGKP
jgi:hypothetical protein